jgi:hypothetical protein
LICQDARRLIGAEPYATSGELAEHLHGCEACAEFQLEMVALEADIRRALGEPPVASRGRLPIRRLSRPAWALAASVLLAVLATLALWALRPGETLAEEVVAHVDAEPQSWAGTQDVSPSTLGDILRKSGVVLDTTSYSVIYARSCWFRGHYVPHLVVRTPQGLVTVVVLRNERVGKRETFHEDGLAGVIVPAPQGSIAVLARGGGEIDNVAKQMQLAIRSPSDSR